MLLKNIFLLSGKLSYTLLLCSCLVMSCCRNKHWGTVRRALCGELQGKLSLKSLVPGTMQIPTWIFFFILFYFFKAQGMHNGSGAVRLGTMLERRRVVNNVKYKVCREAKRLALDQMR